MKIVANRANDKVNASKDPIRSTQNIMRPKKRFTASVKSASDAKKYRHVDSGETYTEEELKGQYKNSQTAKDHNYSYERWKKLAMENDLIEPIKGSRKVTAADEEEDSEYLDQLCAYIENFLSQYGYTGYATYDMENVEVTIELDNDELDEITYLQPLDEIIPNWDDITSDADTIADAAIEEIPEELRVDYEEY